MARGGRCVSVIAFHAAAAKEHGRSVVEAFLWGLLPDNDRVLDRWAAKFHVSARNVFALISHVGEDCAGAVQFVTPDRLNAIRSGNEDKIEWLSESDIAKRLQALRLDHAGMAIATRYRAVQPCRDST